MDYEKVYLCKDGGHYWQMVEGILHDYAGFLGFVGQTPEYDNDNDVEIKYCGCND